MYSSIKFCLVLTDVVSIPKTNENFRLLYDTKGRFRLHSIRDEEAKVMLFSPLKYAFSFFLQQGYHLNLKSD